MSEYLRFDKIKSDIVRRTLLILIYPVLIVLTLGIASFTFLREFVAVVPKEFMEVWREPTRY